MTHKYCPLTLEQAFRLAKRNRVAENEPFYVLQHRETGAYCVCRHRFLDLWLDDFKVVLTPKKGVYVEARQ